MKKIKTVELYEDQRASVDCAIEALGKAKALLAQKGAWTQGAFARDSSGGAISYTGEGAAQFCMLGAINKVSYNDAGCNKVAVKALCAVVPHNAVAAFNDKWNRRKATVLKKFDEAAALLQAAKGE